MKKIALIAACLVSTNVFADVVSSTRVDSVQQLTFNYPSPIFSGHDYTIDNHSGSTQTVQICFDVTSCPEAPAQTKNHHECINETVQNGQTISREKVIQWNVLYKFSGYCKLIAKTQMSGWTHHESSAEGKIKVWPH